MTKTIGYIRTSKNSQNLGVEVQKKHLFVIKLMFFYRTSVRKERESKRIR